MSYPEIQHSSYEGEVPSSDVMALQQSLQHKHEQLVLSTEVVNQLTQQTQRQSLSIHILSTKLTVPGGVGIWSTAGPRCPNC